MLCNIIGQIFDSTLDRCSTILLIFCLFSFLKMCRNHYFYSVVSPKLPLGGSPPKIETLFVNTIALFFPGPFFCVLGFLLYPVFWVFLLKGMTKGTQNNQERNKTTRCKPENHFVLFTKNRQHRHKTIQLHCLDRKQTTHETKSENKNNWT